MSRDISGLFPMTSMCVVTAGDDTTSKPIIETAEDLVVESEAVSMNDDYFEFLISSQNYNESWHP